METLVIDIKLIYMDKKVDMLDPLNNAITFIYDLELVNLNTS